MDKLRGNKTTWVAILTIGIAVAQAGLAYLQHQPIDWHALTIALSAAGGLHLAADSKQ